MDPPPKVTIAIIGLGIIGPRHALAVQSCPDATLLCVVSPPGNSTAISVDVPFYPSVSDMLQSIEVLPNAAIVCTPNHTHVEISTELLLAGIDVLVEKPISTDLVSARDVIELARLNGRKLAVGHHRRFNPYVTATKRVLEEGSLGRVVALNGLWTTFKPDGYFAPPAEWRGEKGTGGPVLINFIHEVDLLQFLLGDIVRVSAERTLSSRHYAVEEGAAVMLRFRSGVVGTFLVSDAVPSEHGFESGTGENPLVPHSGKDFWRIFGSRGTLSVGDMVLSTSIEGEERSWGNVLRQETVEVERDVVPLEEQVKNFVRVVRGEEEARCSGEDALKALVVCEAVKRAMESGLPVDIPEQC